MPDLLLHDFDGGNARCAHCGALAVGPCARCDAPLCGDCCVITKGGAKPYAICRDCVATRGRSIASGWRTVVGWILLPIVVLLVLVYLLSRVVGP